MNHVQSKLDLTRADSAKAKSAQNRFVTHITRDTGIGQVIQLRSPSNKVSEKYTKKRVAYVGRVCVQRTCLLISHVGVGNVGLHVSTFMSYTPAS